MTSTTPPRAGIYRVGGSKHELRRHWHPATGFSAPFYADDPIEIVERAMRTPADRENAGSIVWHEVQ